MGTRGGGPESGLVGGMAPTRSDDQPSWLPDGGPRKKKKKQVMPASTETSIVLVSAPRMVFPDLGITHPVRNKRKSSSTTSKAAKKKKSSATSVRSGQGSNQPDPKPLSLMMPSWEVADKEENQETQKQVAGHGKKNNRKPNVRSSPAMGTRSKSSCNGSPAMGTRSKRKLNV